MTPNTTPAPMTHEEALAAVDDALRIFAERHWHADHKAMRRVRAHIEAERTRADGLAAEVALLRSDAERIASCPWRVQKGCTALCQPPKNQRESLARIAELEAVVGRCEALAEGWSEAARGADNHDQYMRGLDDAADHLRTALQGQERGRMGEEGRDGG